MNNHSLLSSMPGGLEWIVLLLVFLAVIFFWIRTIIEIARGEFTGDSTKIIWLLIVLTTGILGVILYWIFGRKYKISSK